MWCYVTEDVRARADAVLADVLAPMLHRPAEQLRAMLPIGSAEECAEKLLAYARAGAQRLFLGRTADERTQLEVFRERVVPLLDGEQALGWQADSRRARPPGRLPELQERRTPPGRAGRGLGRRCTRCGR